MLFENAKIFLGQSLVAHWKWATRGSCQVPGRLREPLTLGDIDMWPDLLTVCASSCPNQALHRPLSLDHRQLKSGFHGSSKLNPSRLSSPAMRTNPALLLPAVTAIVLFAFAATPGRAQTWASGTFGTLTVTGTTSVNLFDIQGNSFLFGSWTGTPSKQGVNFTYSETSGTGAFTELLTQPASAWNWQRWDSS